jgi:Ca-activated chloride channel homolog
VIAQPHYLWGLLLAVIAGWWLMRRANHRRLRLQQVMGKRLEQEIHAQLGRRRRVGRVTFPLAFACTVLAAAQPHWGKSEDAIQPPAKRWVVCLDVSRSMLAQDQIAHPSDALSSDANDGLTIGSQTLHRSAQTSPTRLRAARDLIEQFCGQVGGDQMALIPFAGKARLMVPLTEDLAALIEMLELSSDRRLVGGGSDLGAALKLALQTVEAAGEPKPTAVLVLSDGEDWGAGTEDILKLCKEKGLILNCVGFGSRLGSKVPLDGAFLQDADGADVITALQADELQQIAAQSGGIYLHADALHANSSNATEAAQLLLDRAATQAPKSGLLMANAAANAAAAGTGAAETTNTNADLSHGLANRFQLPLALACLLWLMELLAALRRRK